MHTDVERAAIDTAAPRALAIMGIPSDVVAALFDLSVSDADALMAGTFTLPPGNPNRGELLTMIEMYQMLYSLLGQTDQVHRWLNGVNLALDGSTPVQLLGSVDGLHRVVAYLRSALG